MGRISPITSDEHRRISELAAQGLSATMIGKAINRHANSIVSYAARKNIALSIKHHDPPRRFWPECDVAAALRLATTGTPLDKIATILGRTAEAVRHQLNLRGVSVRRQRRRVRRSQRRVRFLNIVLDRRDADPLERLATPPGH